MDEEVAAGTYIHEMLDLISAAKHHLNLLGSVPGEEQRRHEVLELGRLGATLAELGAGLPLDDCVEALGAFTRCFPGADGGDTGGSPLEQGTLLPAEILAGSAELLAYLQERLLIMARHGRALPPSDSDRLALSHMILTLEQARERPIGAQLTPEEQALVRSFQTSQVRQRASSPLPFSGAMVSDADLDYIPPDMKRSFLVETGEDLQDIGRMVLNFEQHPDDESAILSEMGRLAHKIKGTGSTLGFDVLAAVTLVFEDGIRALQSRAVVARPEAVGSLTGLLALIESALEAAVADQPSDAALGELITHAETLRDELLSARGLEWDDPAKTHPPEAVLSGQIVPGPTGAETDSSSSRLRINDIESFLRVEVHRLDELMTHVNALALNRASFIQMRDDILRLQGELDQALARLDTVSHQVTDLNPQQGQGWLSAVNATTFTAAPTPRPTYHSYVAGDGLVSERFSEFDQALRQLTEVVADTTSASKYLRSALTRLDQIGDEQATITHDIQRDVMQIRLVHLEDLMPRIQLEARRLAASLGKAISFTTRGQMTEIDRNISEALAEPLIQLVRNAVVHGIESGEERVEHGKSLTGNIWIHAYYVGSEVVIEVGDDGRGVNPHRLAASAVALGLVDAEAARRMAFSEALDMMFVPGITTFREAQIVAGRGIGLDEVRTAIQRLKGIIQVRSEPGKGSVFRIRVPISLSIVRALGVQVAGQPFAVPFSSVQQMISVSQEDLSPLPPTAAASVGGMAARASLGLRLRVDAVATAHEHLEEDKGMPHHQGTGRGIAGASEVMYEHVPALRLADLLGFESSIPTTQLALILEVGRRRVALLVDQVSDDQEVVVQTLPSHLRRRSIRGTTVTPDGLVQLLLDLPELLQSAQSGDQLNPAPRRKPLPPAEVSKAPRVLVVDDSMSIRGALELTLTRAGFDVQLARDGIEAFEMMRVAVPRVVVLDIEMPRLDGFELLSVMRETPQFAEIRVVMLTSRAADKHREQALKLGAAAYLIKPCPQETLIETVRAQLINQTSQN